VTVAEGNENTSSGDDVVEGGKKDPFLRRQELLVNSGLAEVRCFTFWILYLHFIFI
jgi:pumilio family protein 6